MIESHRHRWLYDWIRYYSPCVMIEWELNETTNRRLGLTVAL